MKLAKFKNEHIQLSMLGILIGLLSGGGAVMVRALIKFFKYICYGDGTSILTYINQYSIFYRLMIPTVGGLIVGLLIYFFAKEAKGHGVPEVMTACLLEGGKIRGIVAAIKALASSICIGTGGSVGREGPLVQIGASLGSVLGKIFHRDAKGTRTLVACGAAGGIAAAFNAPFSGCLFAVEIILGDFAVTSFSPIVISSVVATLVSHQFEGDFPTFSIPTQYRLESPLELIPYTVLGILCGLGGLAFIKFLYKSEDIFDDWKFPEYLKPAVGGLLLGAIGIGFPQVLGVGYDSMRQILTDQLSPFRLVFILFFLKLIATSLTLGSGGSGGVFAPSLFLGSMLGSMVGSAFGHILPAGRIANPGAYAMVGMGAMVAGATHAPITAIIIIFELTRDNAIILPLMFACIISSILTSSLKEESIYTEKLSQRGIIFREGKEEGILKSVRVKPYIQKEFLAFQFSDPMDQVLERLISSRYQTFPVLNKNKNIIGILTSDYIKIFFRDLEEIENITIAGDVMRKVPLLKPTMNLRSALDVFKQTHLEELPVEENGKVLGLMSELKIFELYDNEIMKRNLAISLLNKKKYSTSISSGYDIGDGFWMKEIKIPEAWEGKRLENLNLRDNYKIEVIMGRKNDTSKNILPTGRLKLSSGDLLKIVGRREDIQKLINELQEQKPNNP